MWTTIIFFSECLFIFTNTQQLQALYNICNARARETTNHDLNFSHSDCPETQWRHSGHRVNLSIRWKGWQGEGFETFFFNTYNRTPWRGRSWARWWPPTSPPSTWWWSLSPPPSSSYSSSRQPWVWTWQPRWWWQQSSSARWRACPPPLPPRWSTTGSSSASWSPLPRWCFSLPWSTSGRRNWKRRRRKKKLRKLSLKESMDKKSKRLWNFLRVAYVPMLMVVGKHLTTVSLR